MPSLSTLLTIPIAFLTGGGLTAFVSGFFGHKKNEVDILRAVMEEERNWYKTQIESLTMKILTLEAMVRSNMDEISNLKRGTV